MGSGGPHAPSPAPRCRRTVRVQTHEDDVGPSPEKGLREGTSLGRSCGLCGLRPEVLWSLWPEAGVRARQVACGDTNPLSSLSLGVSSDGL